MKYSEKQLNSFIEKALSIVGADKTYSEILEEEKELNKGKKKPKDYKPYYLRFIWQNEKQVEEYRKYLEKEIKRLHPEYDENKLRIDADIVDSLTSLSEINIIHEKMKVIDEQLKTEKI